jgi:hypothetical protein
VSTWLERQRNLLDYALGSLTRRAGRSLVLVAAYGLVVYLVASILLLGGALRARSLALLEESPRVLLQRMVMGRHALSSESERALAEAVRGVLRSSGRLWGYFEDGYTGEVLTLRGLPPDDPAAPPEGQAILGAPVAARRGLTAGKTLTLVHTSGAVLLAPVHEVLPESASLVAGDTVVLPEADFREFFDLAPSVYTDLALEVRNPQEVSVVLGKLARALPHHRALTRSGLQGIYGAALDWRQGFLLTPMLAALLAFALLVADRASGLSADEQREVGILKAIGWGTGDVLQMKLLESFAVAATASLGGFLAAYAHLFWLGGGPVVQALAGWSVLRPQPVPAPAVTGVELLTLLLVTVVPYLAATLVPVWRAATIDPDAVMR